MSSDTKQGDDVAVKEAQGHLEQLSDLEDYYFGADKDDKRKALVESALACSKTATASGLRADGFFIKGRALSFLPDRDGDAEEFLSKALKLDPKMHVAWNALGEVHWGRQKYEEAKSSFEKALEMCGPNAVSLRNLSMVLRAVGGTDEERALNYEMGLKKAKEATVLDASDPLNWETLGNAYMGEFFVNGKRQDTLNRALLAYDKAEGMYDKAGKRNPTLHMNRGTAAKFLEDYALAQRSFQKASDIGAAKGGREAEQVVELVQKLAGLVDRKGGVKQKRLREMTSNIASHLKGARRSLAHIRAGEGGTFPLVAKVICYVDRGDEVPVILVCSDYQGDFFSLSIYNAEPTKLMSSIVPLESTIEIEEPRFRQVCIRDLKGTQVGYPSIRVAHPGDISVVGAANLSAAAVQSVFSVAKEMRGDVAAAGA